MAPPLPAALGLLLLAGPVAAQPVYTGALEAGDDRLASGEFADRYTVTLEAGQALEADLTSSDFDPYLVLVAPSGAQEENDDYLGSQVHSRLVTTAAEGGAYTVVVTSYAAGETGAYRLELDAGRAPVVPPPGASTPGASASGASASGASASGASRPPASSVVGRWVGGAITATQYEDRATGAPAPTTGIGTTLTLAADGTYRQVRVMNQTTYGCTSAVHVDERGTYAAEGGALVLRRASGRSWGQVCGGAPYDRTLEPETERFAVAVGPGRGGAATLTRHQDGEFFDELHRAD